MSSRAAALLLAAACSGALRAPSPGAGESACARCHGAAIAADARRRAVHEPFRRGACVGCHVPHAPSGGASTLAASEPDLCRRCHETAGAPHPGPAACTACHAAHASDEPRLLVAPRGELCRRCHAGAPLETAHGGLPVAGAACARCHLPHGVREKLLPEVVHAVAFECGACHAAPGPKPSFALREGEPALCLGCHDDPRVLPARGSLHRAAVAGPCTRCHDPHASRERALLAAPEREGCLSCHAPIRREVGAVAAHAPARTDCISCHLPHASRERALLREAEAALCVRCHGGAAAWTRAKHVHAPVREGRCGACHDAHGGRARLLVEEGSLVCGSCHAPAKGVRRGHARADCLACHEPHASQGARLLAAPAEERCARCHRASLEKPRERRHGPFAAGACLACHAVHADAAALAPDPAKACVRCHEGKRTADAPPDGTVHPPFAAGACLFCHDPHGSPRRAHLREEPALLCLSCHAALQARVKRPACTGCHDPHVVRGG